MLLIFVLTVSGGSAHALWGEQKKESKLDKDAYETLVKKNLDLRSEVDKLVKEQEQLRGIYKILLEKVKTLQRDNAELSEQLKSAPQNKGKKNGAPPNTIVAEPYTEPESDARGHDRAKGLQEGIFANKEIVEKQAETIRAQDERISALEDELAKLEGVFDTAALKKSYPEAFAGREDAAKFMASQPAKRVREEVDKLSAKQKAANEQLSALDKDIEGSSANHNDLKGKVESVTSRIAELKGSIADTNAEIKNESEKSLSEQDRIKGLESSLDKAVSEQRDCEVRLQDAAKRIGQIEESIKKAAAVPAPKDSPADFKSDEVKSLEKELEKASNDEKYLRETAAEAGRKVEDLKSAISEARDRSEEGAASAESAKERNNALDKDIAGAEAEENTLKKDIRRAAKNTEDLEQKRAALAADIAAEERKIRDLKRIIEKEMLEIGNAGPSQGRSEGLAGEARSALSALNNRIRELQAKNEELEKNLKNAERSGDRPLRKNELPPDVKQKLDKERLDMHYNLAVVYDKNKMYKDAEREYLKCLKIDPNDPDTIYNLGILYDDKLHNVHSAANYYKKYLAIRPMGEGSTQVRIWLTNIELEERIGKEVR